MENSFSKSLRLSTLTDAMIDVAESSIDSILANELVKQIPIIKTLVGTTQAVISIQDKLFLKKMIMFLSSIGDVSIERRNKEIDLVDGSKKYRMKVGEKLLYILDKCDDHEVAERIARLFSAFLKQVISYDEYLDASRILTRLSDDELELFITSYRVTYMNDDAKQLIYTGLVFSDTEPINVDVAKREAEDWDDTEQYETDVSGGEVTYSPTLAGDTIFEVFGIGKNAKLDELRNARDSIISDAKVKLHNYLKH